MSSKVLRVRLTVCFVEHYRKIIGGMNTNGTSKKKVVCKTDELWDFNIPTISPFVLEGRHLKYVEHITKIASVEFDMGAEGEERWVKDEKFALIEFDPKNKKSVIDVLNEKLPISYENVKQFVEKVTETQQELSPVVETIDTPTPYKYTRTDPFTGRSIRAWNLVRLTQARDTFVDLFNEQQRRIDIIQGIDNFDTAAYGQQLLAASEKPIEAELLLNEIEKEEEPKEATSRSRSSSNVSSEWSLDSEYGIEISAGAQTGDKHENQPKLEITYSSVVNEEGGNLREYEANVKNLMNTAFEKFDNPTDSIKKQNTVRLVEWSKFCRIVALFEVSGIGFGPNREDISYVAQFLDDVEKYIKEDTDKVMILITCKLGTTHEFDRFVEVFKDLFKRKEHLIKYLVTVGYPIVDKNAPRIFIWGNKLIDNPENNITYLSIAVSNL